jgi:hypothetical protein
MKREIVRRIRQRRDGVVQIVAGPPPVPPESRWSTVIALVTGSGVFIGAVVVALIHLAPLGPLVFWA